MKSSLRRHALAQKAAFNLALSTLISGSFAHGDAALYNTFYPQSINSTTWITNASIGTYHGSVYQAATYNATTAAAYGTYDYCSMPHPRTQEYQPPGPVANGSVKAELVYLHYVQRHQRRTPYNILPGGENQAYHCDNVRPFLYAGPGEGIQAQAPMNVYAASYTDPTNPFSSSYVQGTCQYPQITIGGVIDGLQHGNDLWSVYGEKLHFLPSTPDNTTFFRSSESALTQDTAGAVLRGIWPHYHYPVPLHQQASAVDTVNEGFSCNLRNSILSSIESTPLWDSHLQATAPLLAELSSYTQNQGAWTSTFDHLSDNFQARLCNGYELPCNVEDTSECVTTAQAYEVFRAGDWEWNYYWRSNPNVTTYIQTVEGLFIGEILQGFSAVQNGTSAYKYSHTFVHDGDIGPICGALGIEALRWPGMGSNLAFELWRVANGPLYARVLYSGQPIKTIHGVLDWVPLSALIDILTPFVPVDAVALCKQ